MFGDGIYEDLLKIARYGKLAEAVGEDIMVRGLLPGGSLVSGALVDIVSTPEGDKAIIRDKRGKEWPVDFAGVETYDEIEAANARRIQEEGKIEKRPEFMRIDPLEFDNQGELARFLGYLVGPGKVHFYLESPPKYSEMALDQYYALTGERISPMKGLYNISPEEGGKWSFEGSIYFTPTNDMPHDLTEQQEKAGQINRIQLFWSLVKLGFRLSPHQDPAKIREHIPDDQKTFFDEGLNAK